MLNRIVLCSVVSLVTVSLSLAQDFTRMDLNAMNNAFNARMNQQMNTMTQSVVQQNLNNPHVQAMYRQHLAQGGRQSPEQFAYNYAATGGFTPNGMAYFRATEARNQAAEMNSLNGLRMAQANRAAAQNDYMSGFQRNNAEFGNLMMGNSTYSNPWTGTNPVLPHTLQAGQVYRNAAGQYYRMDGQGNYSMFNNGMWYPLNAGR